MMKTPKEKAKELVNRFDVDTIYVMTKPQAKQCAKIAVDEILDAITFNMYDEESYNQANNFWEEVKKEVEAYKK